MADVQIEAAATGILWAKSTRLGPVWVDESTGYVFYIDANDDLVYRKTANSGVDWAAAVGVHTGTVFSVSVWFDKWTPGDSGDKIHIAYMERDAHDVLYRNLDTSTDTLSAEKTVFDGVSSAAVYTCLDITKSRGGNLYCGFWIDPNGENGFYRSVDGGDNWAARANVGDGLPVDPILLLPGAEADNNDIWCIYWDASANEISLKVYDDSENSWGETSISLNMTDTTGYSQMSAAQRASDNHVILAAWNLLNNVAADLMVWDIGGAASIVAKANVLTDSDASVQCAVFINQQNDDIYVAYLTGSLFGVYLGASYKKSDDGGGSWGNAVKLSDDADDNLKRIWAGHSVGDEGGYFMPCWFNDDFDDLMTSTAHAITITAVAEGEVHEGAAVVAGTGTLSAIGRVIRGAAVTLAGAGALTVAAVATLVGAASISGEGTATVAAQCYVPGAASIAGEGTLSVGAVVIYAGAASLLGEGTLSAAGVCTLVGSTSLAGEGTLTASAVVTYAGAAVLSGEGTLSALGVGTFTSTASLAGSGTLTVAALSYKIAAAALAGEGVLTVDAVALRAGVASLSGEGTLSVASVCTLVGVAALSGEGVLATACVVELVGAASLAGDGALSVDAVLTLIGAASLSGEGTLSVSCVRVYSGAAALAADGSLAVGAVTAYSASVSLSGRSIAGNILGDDHESTTYAALRADWKAASKFTLSVRTTVDEIRVYIEGLDDPAKARAFIYADDDGEPAALLATSDEIIGIQDTLEWRTFTFGTPVDLNAGTYWLGLHVGDNRLRVHGCLDGAEDQFVLNTIDFYADGPDDPWNGVTYFDYYLNIYIPLGIRADVLVRGAASLAGEGTLSVAGIRIALGAASLSGEGTFAAIASPVLVGVASLSGEGVLIVSPAGLRYGQASLSGEGTLTVLGWIVSAAVVPVGYATADVTPTAQASADVLPGGNARREAPKHGFARVPPL